MSEHKASPLGNYIKAKREALNLELKEVADRTAIRIYILEILEAGDFEALPSYVHAHGFLSQYSKVLGLNFAKDVKPRFDEECCKETFGISYAEEAEKTAPINQSDFEARPGNMRNIIIAAVVIIIAVVVYLFFNNMKGSEPVAVPTATYGVSAQPPESNVNHITPMPEDSEITTEHPAEAILPTETPTPSPEPAEPVLRTATLSFSGDCWTNYESDDGSAGDFIAISGSERTVTFHKYFRLHLGNAAALTVKYNANELTNFGATGQPIRNLYFVRNDDGKMTMTRTSPSGQALENSTGAEIFINNPQQSALNNQPSAYNNVTPQ